MPKRPSVREDLVSTSDPWTSSAQVQPDVNTLTGNAAAQAYEQADRPDDLDLVELYDCFATAELIHYDNLGLCEPEGPVTSSTPVHRSVRPHAGQCVGRPDLQRSSDRRDGIANIYEVATHLVARRAIAR